jgi:predicted YcjX-like family ATPase
MQTSERLTVDRTAKIALRLATCGLPRAGRAASHSARVRRFSHRID